VCAFSTIPMSGTRDKSNDDFFGGVLLALWDPSLWPRGRASALLAPMCIICAYRQYPRRPSLSTPAGVSPKGARSVALHVSRGCGDKRTPKGCGSLKTFSRSIRM
jgi:hypothetical protein